MTSPDTTSPDTPGVIAPPPLIALAAVVIGIALDWLLPIDILTVALPFWPRLVIGFAFAAAGSALALAGVWLFKTAGTNVEPWKPTLRLVTTGIYARLRNPMYAGLLLLVLGLAVALASDWTLLMFVLMALILHYGVVVREERYLETKFGDDYRRYKARVPRWG
ncbi:MAG TPA: isoprenylcysteine carboxylmethyltransferase family protein, partial [Xanthobacteraceae bacterium]|nr:isoprenylcysteine carboxylmethyltransferase family protein [Xanthobacteraceae bacterium]